MNERGTAADRDDWDSHWRGYSEAAAHNPAQEYRRRLILEILAGARAGPTSRLLDVGAGTGDLSLELGRAFPGADVLGVDVSHDGVEIARSKVPDAEFVQRDLLESGADPAHHGWATHAVCSEVLEHVDDPGRLLRNARSYLGQGARLVVTVPGGPMSRFDQHIGHRRHYTASELVDLLEASGFDVDVATGAGFPFFNLYRLVVILRGRQLIRDIEDTPSVLARAVMGLFRWLFYLNTSSSRWGWQTVASARVSKSRLP
jgi:SAM-dependent methyltransferase